MSLAGLIIVLLAIAFLLRVDFIFFIVYACSGIYISGRWLVPKILKQITIGREFTDHAFLGETIEVRLRWHNASRLPLPWLEFSESIPPALRIGETMQHVITLRGKELREFTYQVKAGRRGFYQLGPLRLSTGDLFGLVKGETGYLDTNYLTIYPQIVSLSHLGIPSRLPFGTVASQQRLFEDPARPVGVRDYLPGDSQRHINWKVSAHTNHLFVKRFEPAISLETVVLLNLHRADYQKRDWRYHTERAIITAASLANYLIDQRQATGLISNGVDPLQQSTEPGMSRFDEASGRLLQGEENARAPGNMPAAILPRKGRNQLIKILEHLARIESEETVSFPQWSTRACLQLSWGVTVLAVTARGDDLSCQALHRLVRSGLNPILVGVEPDNNFGQVKERARRLGFAAYNVAEPAGLDQWRQARGQAMV